MEKAQLRVPFFTHFATASIGDYLTISKYYQRQYARDPTKTQGKTSALPNKFSLLPFSDGHELVVFDANEKRVGKVLGFEGDAHDPVIAFEADGLIFALLVRRPGFFSGDTQLLFESVDCTGKRFIRANPSALMPPAAIGPPGQSIYVPKNLAANGKTIFVGSEYSQGECYARGFEYSNLVPARKLMNLKQEYKPPLSVR